MTDYNDGKWHGWNGGECPVHPESVVQFVAKLNAGTLNEWSADQCDWDSASNPIIAFRVVKPCREPREGWIASTIFATAREAKVAYPGCKPIKVREVIE